MVVMLKQNIFNDSTECF